MNLTRTAITRPVFILMLMMAALLMGTIAYKSMRLELNPDVSFPVVTVNTIYTGASPDEINTLVSKRIEDSISGVTNMRELTSTSQEGFSTVVANFEIGTDINVALNDVRTRVDAILSSLPDGIQRPTIVKLDNSSQPVLYLAFNSADRNSQQLRDLLDNKLADKFSQIGGVAQATVQGGDVREIQIQLDKNKLLAYKIGIADVTRQIVASTQNIPGGRIISGNQEYTVRVLGEWKSLDQIRNSILTVSDFSNPNGRVTSVRMGDIATVVDTVQERTSYSRLNGSDTVVLAIQKSREGNAVEITKQADLLIKQIQTDYPDLKITKTLEQAKQISDSLSDLNFTLMFAIFLVSGVVYLFLHNFRGTLIVAIAIPVCVFVTFCAMWLVGFTINSMSMLALILAVGVLVDDAIVVLENIFRHLRMGEDPREAAINGRGEIGMAALAISLADIVVFLPIGFMGGIVGQFFKPLALSYVFAVVTSLFVSFTITPMLAARWYKAGEDLEHPTAKFPIAFERAFHRLEEAYRRALEWSLNHRWFVFISGNSALVGIILFIKGGFAGLAVRKPFAGASVGEYPMYFAIAIGVIAMVGNSIRFKKFMPKFALYGVLFGLIFPAAGVLGGFFGVWKGEAPFKFEFIPSTDGAQVTVNIKLAPDASLAATQQVVSRIENIVKQDPNVKYVLSNVGTQGVGQFSGGGSSGSNYAQILATLYDKGSVLDRMPFRGSHEKLRWVSDSKVAADLLEKIGRVPGADLKISNSGGQAFGSPIQMSFRADDSALLAQTTANIVRKLQSGAIKGVINADVSTTPGKPELQAIPDRSKLADAGLTVSDVGAAIRAMYTGDDTAKFRVSGNEYKIRVQLSPQDKNDPKLVSEVPVAFKSGDPIFLGAVTDLQQEPSVDKISRRARQQEIQVTADLLPGFAAGSVQAQITQWLEAQKLVPAGVSFKPLGQADAQQREMGYILGAFGLGLVLVYMVLASLYDNLLYPFIIQLAQPQAMTGAILALVLTDKSFNLVGFIGIITLIGLVGKNAILLVDYTNTLRDRGRNRHDALVEAGPIRLRPIVMTTLALILGTLPIALAIGRGSEFRASIGVVVIGGMTLSTLLTLLVIPCSYTIFDDISGAIARARGLKPSHEGVTPPLGRDNSGPESEPQTTAR